MTELAHQNALGSNLQRFAQQACGANYAGVSIGKAENGYIVLFGGKKYVYSHIQDAFGKIRECFGVDKDGTHQS